MRSQPWILSWSTRMRPPVRLVMSMSRSSLMNGFHDLIALQPFFAALASKAGIFHPAERRVSEADREGVDPDHPAFDQVADQVRAAAILGEGEGGEAVGQAVGLLDDFLERVEWPRDGDRTERLVVHDVGLVGDVGQQGGLE